MLIHMMSHDPIAFIHGTICSTPVGAALVAARGRRRATPLQWTYGAKHSMQALFVGWCLPKKRRLVIGAFLLSAIVQAACLCTAAESNSVGIFVPANAPLSVLADTNTPHLLWFPVGESLRYRLTWGIIPAAEIQATSSWVTVQGRRLVEITCQVRSARVLRWIYPVEDKIVVTIEPRDFLPVLFQVDMREGSHIRHEITTFDYDAGTAVWTAPSKQKTRTIAIDPGLRDLLSFMYYMRKDGLPGGTNLTLRVLVDSKDRTVPVVVGDCETVDVPGHGNVACLRIVPTIEFAVSFNKPDSIAAWISTDARHLCTRAKVSVPIGSLTAELIEVGGPDAAQWPTPALSP